MRGAYVATPLPEVTPDPIPNRWNSRWPYPGAHPPGYTTTPEEDLELAFITPPTPDEIAIDEEITVQIWLREKESVGFPAAPTSKPEGGTSDILWYATIEGVPIWTDTSGWGRVWGYYGQEATFTLPLIDEDIGKTLTLYADWTVVFDGVPYSVSAEHNIEIKDPLSLSLTCGATTISTSNPYFWPTPQTRMAFKVQIWNGDYLESSEQWQYDQHGFPYGAYYDEAHYIYRALPDDVTVTRVDWGYEVTIEEINPERRYTFAIGTKVGKQPAELEGGVTAELLDKNLDVEDSLVDSGTGYLEEYAGEHYSVAGGTVSIEEGERELTLIDSWDSDSYPWV